MPNIIKNEDILKFLKKKSGFVSGAKIAAALGVTRAAVWKKIKQLKKTGYVIEASRSKGYRLTGAPDFSIDEIKNFLSGRTALIGREIIFFDTVDSTNAVAAELAAKGCIEGTAVIADGQTAGRGRRGRAWVSPPGKNLHMSVVLTPDIPPSDASLLTLMAAVACASAVKKLLPLTVSIKWPNDLIVSGKKLGGILTEIKADMDRIFHSIVGIGVNINLDACDMPEEIRPTATSIKRETGKSYPRTEFAAGILEELDRWYAVLLNSGKSPVIGEWLRLSSTIGRAVKVASGSNTFAGIAEGITDEGMLILKLPDNSLKKISAGDVVYI